MNCIGPTARSWTGSPSRSPPSLSEMAAVCATPVEADADDLAARMAAGVELGAPVGAVARSRSDRWRPAPTTRWDTASRRPPSSRHRGQPAGGRHRRPSRGPGHRACRGRPRCGARPAAEHLFGLALLVGGGVDDSDMHCLEVSGHPALRGVGAGEPSISARWTPSAAPSRTALARSRSRNRAATRATLSLPTAVPRTRRRPDARALVRIIDEEVGRGVVAAHVAGDRHRPHLGPSPGQADFSRPLGGLGLAEAGLFRAQHVLGDVDGLHGGDQTRLGLDAYDGE